MQRTQSERATVHLLGPFEIFRKATISFVMTVRLSVRTEQLESHWKNFDEI